MTLIRENTQELGVPITREEQEKLLLLSELQVIDLHDWLNPYSYPAELQEARVKFKEKFAFYDLLTLAREEKETGYSTSLVKVAALWREFMDWCACPPKILLERKRYSANLIEAKAELEQHIAVYDCYKGNIICYGPLRSGKSGYIAVHAWHGKEWFDIPVVCYRSRYNDEAFGDYIYLDEHKLMDSVSSVSEIVNKRGNEYFRWIGKTKEDEAKVKEDFMDKLALRNVFIVIDESNKVVGKDHRTLLSFFWEDRAQEWGHYQCGTVYITPEEGQLNKDRILANTTIKISVARCVDLPETSTVRIHHLETGEHKPTIFFCRKDYYPLWAHNAPIASRSLVTSKDIHDWNKRHIKAQEIKEELGYDEDKPPDLST